MSRTQSAASLLADRLVRPQRLGVFGRRGVGKTTLLAQLYRQSAAGRLPGLRLAAADARTADYLAEKIHHLETGQILPATLSETELRLNIYLGERRVELVLLDYQGEHVAVGRRESVRDFLRDCDAVWILLDGERTDPATSALPAQQEVEQIVEDYLAVKDVETPHRPVALMVTKADFLKPMDRYLGANADAAGLAALADARFGMARHALVMHCPWSGLFAVSSLGVNADGPAPIGSTPAGLAEPLVWLLDALQAQDAARLEHLRQQAMKETRPLVRGLECFAQRYPQHEAIAAARQHLRALRRQRLKRRGLIAGTVVASLFLLVWAYDALGGWAAQRFAAEHPDDPAAVREVWHRYQTWHPTRNLLHPAAARKEQELLRELDAKIRAQEGQERLQDVRRKAAELDANPEEVWQTFQSFQADFPEFDLEGDLNRFQAELHARKEAERTRRARTAFGDIERAEAKADLPALVDRVDDFLKEFAGTPLEKEARGRRETYLRRIDERDFETARTYSAQQPLNFHTRMEKFRHYLERHPAGAFVKDAAAAKDAIGIEWDKHDFRLARDQFQARPLDLKEVEARCRAYIAAHADGKYRSAAADLLRWCERSAVEGEYRVQLKSGAFERKVAAYFSRGPRLSVEIEVNGIKHGPSYIAERGLEPTWNFEFPRRIRWKLGDSVVIRVKDHWYYRRNVLEMTSEEGDPLAMRLLSGTVYSGDQSLTFESDFRLPTLPELE